MTTFGKLVMGLLLFIVGTGVYYGVNFFAEKDVNENPVVVATTTDIALSPIATTTEAISSEQVAGTTTEKSGKKIPFSQFIKQQGTYKCTVSLPFDSSVTKGVVYIGSTMKKAVFTSTMADHEMITTMVMRDGYTYTWNTMVTGTGYNVKIDDTKTSTTTMLATYAWTPDQIGEYSCEEWKPS